jgi:hypothetical protein
MITFSFLQRMVRLSFCLLGAAILAACASSPRSSYPYIGEFFGGLPLEHTTKADVEKLLGNGPNGMNEVTKRERRPASAKARTMRCPEGTLDVYVVDYYQTIMLSGQLSKSEELWFRPDGRLCAYLRISG